MNPFTASPSNKISDRFDGIDSTYEIVALVDNAPIDGIVEASIRFGTGNPITIGSLRRLDTYPEIWTRSWDVPTGLDEDKATLIARLFQPAASAGAYPIEVASDEVEVDLDHKDETTCTATCPTVRASNTVNIAWPAQGGPLGFYRTKDGLWSTTVDGTGATDVKSVKVLYSTSAVNSDPEFTDCTSATERNIEAREQSPPTVVFQAACVLKEGVDPSSVTSLAVVPLSADAVSGSGDSRRVSAYIQQPSAMQVALTPLLKRLKAGSGCQSVAAAVTDSFGRPVKGVNLDVRLQGPTDVSAFGQPLDSQPPEGAPKQSASNCSGGNQGEQGSFLVAQGPDVKHIESIKGSDYLGRWPFKVASPESGMSEITAWVDDEDFDESTLQQGLNNDILEEGEPTGMARRQWLDDALSIAIDQHLDTAPVGYCNAYTVTALAGDSFLAGTNIDMHLRFPNDNFLFCDVDGASAHRDPDKGEHPPDNRGNSHGGGSALCPDAGPDCRHIEGETDSRGRFTVGITSTVRGASQASAAGPASITAWVDGEPGEDDDVLTAGSVNPESSTKVLTNWIEAGWDTRIKLLGPPAPSNSRVKIGGATFDVIARVDAPYLVDSVDILIGRDKIGEASRIGHSDTFVFQWDLTEPLPEPGAEPSPSPSPSPSTTSRPTPTPRPTQPEEEESPTPGPLPSITPPPPPPVRPLPTVGPGDGVPDGDYALRARIGGYPTTALMSVTVNRHLNPSASVDQTKNDTNSAYEWAQIEFPAEGQIISLANGAIPLEGTASSRAEGVYFYYASGPAHSPVVWSGICGYQDLDGSNSAPQEFSGSCEMNDVDKPSDVVAVAAVAFDCTVEVCDSNPAGSPVGVRDLRQPRAHGDIEAGEARRVFVCAQAPCVVMQPEHIVAPAGQCERVIMTVVDASGLPMVDQNVDVTASGPRDRTDFCDLSGVTSSRSAPSSSVTGQMVNAKARYAVTSDPFGPDIVQTEGQTNEEGQFIVGVRSADSSYTSISAITQDGHSLLRAWADVLDDDLEGSDESGSSVLATWELPGRCSIVGSSGDDTLFGTVEDDKICGLGGADVIYGFDGRDVLVGGGGDDELWGDEKKDALYGGPGDDVLRGGPGDDVLDGGPGSNTCNGGGGRNRVASCQSSRSVP